MYFTVKVPTQKTSCVVETLQSNAGDLSIAWDETMVSIPYKF